MTKQDTLDLYEYNRWANQRVLEACVSLQPEEWTHGLGGSFGSIQATFAHLVAAEWVWLERWEGRSPMVIDGHLDLSTPEAVRAGMVDVDSRRDALLQALEGADLQADLAYSNTKGDRFSSPLWRLLRHVVNHGTYHRGQVANYLRMLGKPAVSTDMVLFDRERSGT